MSRDQLGGGSGVSPDTSTSGDHVPLLLPASHVWPGHNGSHDSSVAYANSLLLVCMLCTF